ncbi:MAG TPA: C45 family peptidase [Paenalcaligenes sp.]|nr:C45 family peptidase [Paenalcaligenes sp.]
MTSLKYFEISGSPYELGQQLGAFGAEAVHRHLIHTTAWAELMLWRKHPAVAQMQTWVREQFPDIWHELRGLADGLSLPFEDVFIWNARGDLWAQAPDGCSSVLQVDPYPRVTHNEDGDPGFYGHCGIVHARPDQGVAFISFVYPGSIPGHTFAINEHQLSITVNNIRALFVQPGIPRMVLCRAALNCPDHGALVDLLTSHPRSGAFNLNVTDRHLLVHSVEFNDADVSLHRVQSPYFHANHAIHPALRDYPQRITGSSGYRQLQGRARVEHPNFDGDALSVLGDDQHERFPIFRRQEDDTDNENTIATADFHYHQQAVQWAVYDQPSQPALMRFSDLKRL